METPGSNEHWFEKETSVYYKVFRFLVGLIGLWLLLPILCWVFPDGPLFGVAYVLILAIPCVVIFGSGVLGLWGVCLIFLGMRQRQSVLAISLASSASLMTFLILLVLIVHFYDG